MEQYQRRIRRKLGGGVRIQALGKHISSKPTLPDTRLSGEENGRTVADKTQGGPTGENLAAGYPNATASIDAWGTERDEYDFKKAEFSHETGHFTQVVWKDTTSVGCGRRECDGRGGSPGWYVVCEYYPPGNVIGAFEENVQDQVEGVKNGNSEGVVGAASRRAGWDGWSVVLVGLVGWMLL